MRSNRLNRRTRFNASLAQFHSAARTGKKQGGFILSVEAILVISILGIGLLVGITAVRNALFIRNAYRDHTRFLVFDDESVFIGEAVAFDEYDTPLVPFVDYDYGGAPDAYPNYRTLIGVRPHRFTSRQPVFYTTDGCAPPADMQVCLAMPDSSRAAVIVQGALQQAGVDHIHYSTSYLSQMQEGAPLYGLGYEAVDGGQVVGGILYRSVGDSCGGATIESVWISEAPGSTIESICFDVASQPADATFLAAAAVLPLGEKLKRPFRVNPVSNPIAAELLPPCTEGELQACLED